LAFSFIFNFLFVRLCGGVWLGYQEKRKKEKGRVAMNEIDLK